MDSPILRALFSDIVLQPQSGKAVYLQLAEAIIDLIKRGRIPPGGRLPSSRDLAGILRLNRLTITKAFQELEMQGWLEGRVGRGTFVGSNLPELRAQRLSREGVTEGGKHQAGFEIQDTAYLRHGVDPVTTRLHLDDGFPDPSLAPLKELYRAYRAQLDRGDLYGRFGSYGHAKGSERFLDSLTRYLNLTRGLNITVRNVLSVRGTVMGINLVCNGLIQRGDIVVTGVPGWRRAEANFQHAGAQLLGVPIDRDGIQVDVLERLCRTTKVRLVYVTPHHHYPTTVSLPMDRRLELLRLAGKYGFIIFEDDYDYDFHYKHKPLLPLASADDGGMVIYCGSFSKTFSPAFRLGYLVASENAIAHLASVRILLDRQGDHILERAMAELLDDGTIQRSLRKAVAVYRERRDYFCGLLAEELGSGVQFDIPEGGLTVWTHFDRGLDLARLAAETRKKGLYLSDGAAHRYPTYDAHAIRLGFASSTKDALEESVGVLKEVLKIRL
ncbi:aminotransferase-like domain-containing protein [Parapedobacter koreensis]|uniref:GntR family transcriptional regulator / MocR family aminotransferase n=1 Tax=Parapedobacter koreensis TaxID=332977 RepID=A0A1H7TG04_9SPHI|nr:PLP-dependent aminotransferase family protein [Parapedobacter koreensis]SEL83780.1 GntR family transcriptional regulator / MocR family aminotransferase [Parapedobacter koreensis]